MGSNSQIQYEVRQGRRCYICLEAVQTQKDEVGGSICARCQERKQAIIKRHQLEGGYHIKGDSL
jgi:hypothetical protein